jgi:pimeloyl-ACP methyl ester carboxylesterase
VLAPALGAPTVVVPGAGHMIPFTHPQAVIDAIRSDAAAGSPQQGAFA